MRNALRSVVATAIAAMLLTSCNADAIVNVGVGMPQSVVVAPTSPTSVSLTWSARGVGSDFRIERRANLQGDFAVLRGRYRPTPQSDNSLIFVDEGLAPETFYSYRIVPLDELGRAGPPSPIVVARTAPLPGLFLLFSRPTTDGGASASQVPSALPYEVRPIGKDSAVVFGTLIAGEYRVHNPLKPGDYSVIMRRIPRNCQWNSGDSVQTATVSSSAGINTVDSLTFKMTCRDSTLGTLVVRVDGTGAQFDSLVTFAVAGRTDSGAVAFTAKDQKVAVGATYIAFRNLRAGAYEVVPSDVAANCTVTPTRVTTNVRRMGTDTVALALACVRPAPTPPPVSQKPVRVNLSWEPARARVGDTVNLRMRLDLTADTTYRVKAMGLYISVDPSLTLIRRGVPGDFGAVSANRLNASVAAVATTSITDSFTGLIDGGSIRFVVGAGTSPLVTTQTGLRDLIRPNATSIDTTKIWVSEAELEITTGAATNPPGAGGTSGVVAKVNGPYSGTVGIGIPMSSSGSTSTGVTYLWTASNTSASTSASPTFTFAAAGSYTVNLTVTRTSDNAQASDSTVVTVAGATNPPAPTVIAKTNGPYTGTVGTAVQLSSTGTTAGSTLVWDLGNGTTSSLASPQAVYAAAGTYKVKLTANFGGVTAVDSTTATIAAPTNPGTPPPPSGTGCCTLTGQFAGPDASGLITLTLTLDISQDLTETPGVETIASWSIPQLKWDPAVLEYVSVSAGQYYSGLNVSQNSSSSGLVNFGTLTAGSANKTGVITLARVRFRPVGARGSSTTTQTTLGAFLGTAAETNSFNYTPKIRVAETSYSVP